MGKVLLWVDDVRNPFDYKYRDTIRELMGGSDFITIWVKNYDQFKTEIDKGLPDVIDVISFDHDLADQHYDPLMYKDSFKYNELYRTFTEKTGLDCAKYLIEFCQDNNLKLPEYNVHSQNPVGKENIYKLLNNYKKHERGNIR